MTSVQEQKRQGWADQIEQWRASGKSVAAWCREHDLAYQQFFYWRDRFAPKKQQTFVELPEHTLDTGVALEIARVRVILSKGFDPETLRRLIHALGKE